PLRTGLADGNLRSSCFLFFVRKLFDLLELQYCNAMYKKEFLPPSWFFWPRCLRRY
ncbi:unnamed protein product, partial [Amoebophrya sp. A120]